MRPRRRGAPRRGVGRRARRRRRGPFPRLRQARTGRSDHASRSATPEPSGVAMSSPSGDHTGSSDGCHEPPVACGRQAPRRRTVAAAAARSHRRTVPRASALTRPLPSAEKARRTIGSSCPFSLRAAFGVRGSFQISMSPSRDPVASRAPSGEKASAEMGDACAESSAAICVPVAVSYMTTWLPNWALVASSAPSGLRANERTVPSAPTVPTRSIPGRAGHGKRRKTARPSPTLP